MYWTVSIFLHSFGLLLHRAGASIPPPPESNCECTILVINKKSHIISLPLMLLLEQFSPSHLYINKMFVMWAEFFFVAPFLTLAFAVSALPLGLWWYYRNGHGTNLREFATNQKYNTKSFQQWSKLWKKNVLFCWVFFSINNTWFWHDAHILGI